MPDREKVIKGLEELQAWLKHLQTVGYHGDMPEYRERELTVSDALALLKEQEAVKPYWPEDAPFCGACKKGTVGWDSIYEGIKLHKYCPECGRKVLWDV